MAVPSTLRHGIVFLLVLGGLLIAGAGAVWACTATADIAVRPVSGTVGTHVTVRGNFSEPLAEPVRMTWQTADGQVLAEASGAQFTVGIRIPDVAPGTYALIARAGSRQASATFTVTAPPPVTEPPPAATEPPGDANEAVGEDPAEIDAGAGGVPEGSAPPEDTAAPLPAGGDQPAEPTQPGESPSLSPASPAPPPEQPQSGSQPSVTEPSSGAVPSAPSAADAASQDGPRPAQPARVGATPAGAERGVAAPPASASDPAAESSAPAQPAEDAAQPPPAQGSAQESPPVDTVDTVDAGGTETPSPAATDPSSRSVGADLWSGFAAEPALPSAAGVTDDRPRNGTVPAAALLGGGLLVLLAGASLMLARRRTALARSRME